MTDRLKNRTIRNLQRLYTLNPFEQDTIAEDVVDINEKVCYIRIIKALRVPGGWILKISENNIIETRGDETASSFYIPYSEEWNENSIAKGIKF